MTSSNGNIFRVTGPLCGNSQVTGEFPSQRLVTRSFDVFFGLRLNKRLSKQSRRWWFQMPPRSLWRHCSAIFIMRSCILVKQCHYPDSTQWPLFHIYHRHTVDIPANHNERRRDKHLYYNPYFTMAFRNGCKSHKQRTPYNAFSVVQYLIGIFKWPQHR